MLLTSAFTVDEYQDVNLLQQTLLDLLARRNARRALRRSATTTSRSTRSPARAADYLLAHAEQVPARDRHPVSRRTTARRPQVLALANRIVPSLGGAEKTSCARRVPPGSEPVTRAPFPRREARRRSSCDRIQALAGGRRRARADRRPVPHERAAGRLRGAVPRGGDPRFRARRCSAASAARQLLRRLRKHDTTGRAPYHANARQRRRLARSGCRRSSASAR